jgi:hypothetical protein
MSYIDKSRLTGGKGIVFFGSHRLTPSQVTAVRALPLERLEALAEALLEFQGPTDLNRWLRGEC